MNMSETPIDFFAKGHRDVLAEVRTQQACRQWTQERRACWTKGTISEHLHLKHQYPEQRQSISYYAGRVCALKSRLTARYPTLDQKTCGKIHQRREESPVS